MFRYFTVHWNPIHQAPSALVERMHQQIRQREGWELSFEASGLRIYTSGADHGFNEVYKLPHGRGLIAGKLFRKGHTVRALSSAVRLSDADADRIVETDGASLISDFWGRYVAFLPSWTGQLRLLRDPTGALPCYQLEVDGVSIVLSWLDDLLAVIDSPPFTVSWDAVAAHLLFGRPSGRCTALEGISQVLPGELTTIAGREGASVRLWSAVDVARSAGECDSAGRGSELRETVVSCAQSWASAYGSILLRLSGGVDSAILLGALQSGTPEHRVTCLNYFSEGSDSDERRYARLAARRADVTLLERQRSSEFWLADVLNVARTPVPSNYLGFLGARGQDYEIAQEHQANAIFTGACGDQLFFEFQCTWPAADYLQRRGLDAGFPAAVMDAANLGRVSFWRALRLAFTERTPTGAVDATAGRFLTLISDKARQMASRTMRRHIHPEWLDASDLPIGKFHQIGALIATLDYYDPYCERGIERVHPLLSQPVLELCLATPTYVLTKGGQGRALARYAFARDLPSEIATRRSKGGIEEHVTDVLQRNLAFARDMLLEGHLAREGLLNRSQVEAALSGRPGAAAFISEIHTCISIEAWIQRIVGGPGKYST